MLLNEFLDHIKHKNLEIEISIRKNRGMEQVRVDGYKGTVGLYNHSVFKMNYGHENIWNIQCPMKRLFIVVIIND